MGIASGMKGLTQDIAASRKERAKRLGEIKKETKESRERAQGMIKDFQAFRKEAGVRTRQELVRDKAQRESEVRKTRADFRQAQTELRSELKEASVIWQGLGLAKPTKTKQRKEV